MQAILLAAGESSRMHPLSNRSHKSMIKLFGKPLLEHVIEKLKQKNIKDLIIVVGKDGNIESYFGNGSKFGVSIKYVLQEKPEGAGSAVLLSKKYINGDFLLLNSYHVEIDKFIDKLTLAKTFKKEGVLLVKQKENVWDYGVVKVSGDRVQAIIEKPEKGKEPSNLCIVGIYLLSKSFIKILEETAFEHYQLEKALDAYVKEHNVCFIETTEETIVLKYPWDILGIKNYLFHNFKKYVSDNAQVAASAQLLGDVFIEDGVKIMENAVVKGPCYLGKNSYVGTNAILRDGCDIEENSVVGAKMEIKNTLLSAGAKTHSGFIGDSVIGKNCRIGTGFNTANVRLDRATVKTVVKDKAIDTGLKSFGVVVGDNTSIGIKSSTMPGIIIGENVVIGSGTMVMSNIQDNIRYYTKFQEVVSKMRNTIVLFDIDYTLFDTKTFKDSNLKDYSLYEEILPVLSKLSKAVELGIFSKGEDKFQNEKLKRTGIKKLFQQKNVHVFEDKDTNLENVVQKYKYHQIYLIDDKLTVLRNAKLISPSVFTIWIERGPFAQNKALLDVFSPDARIKSLDEAIPVVMR